MHDAKDLQKSRAYVDAEIAALTASDISATGGITAQQAIDAKSALTNLAPAYSAESTYALGAYCTYGGAMYRCTTAITVAEAWTAGHWTAEAAGTVLAEHSSQLAAIAQVGGKSVYNADKLHAWRYKRAVQGAGVDSKLLIGLFSDSVGVGYYAASPMTNDAFEKKSFVGLLSEYYKTLIGDVGVGWKPCNPVTTESYWTFSGTWGDRGAYVVGGRQTLVAGAYATCPFNGTEVDLVLVKDPFGATAAGIYIDDVLNRTVNLDLDNAAKQLMYKVTIIGLSEGAHVIKIVNNATNYLVVCGLHERVGAKGVSVINLSRSGKTTEYLASTASIPTSATQALGLFAYDLVIISYLLNDWAVATNVPIETYKTNLRNFIDIAMGNGSDVIMLAQGGCTTFYSTGVSDYRDAMQEVALEKGVCFVDSTERWKYAIQTGHVTDYLADSVHPNLYGHYDIYKLLLGVLEQ